MTQITNLIFSGLLLFLSFNSQAEEWRINWQHSKISFNVKYMGLSYVDGSFGKYDGGFTFNPSTKRLSNVDFVIQSKSIDTDNDKRDSHLRKKEFFHVSKFPQISFKSTVTVYKDNFPSSIEGLLSIRGISKPVKLDVMYKGIVNDPWDKTKETLFLSASTKILRSDFGMVWNKVMDKGGLILSDVININLEIEAFKSGVRPAFSRFYLPTKNIKKDIKETVIASSPKSSVIVPKKRVVESSIVKETNTGKGMFYTMFFGFVIFIVMIVISVLIQLYLTKFLEKMNFNDTMTLVIPSLIIIVLLVAVATKLAPYMGYGAHPWQ